MTDFPVRGAWRLVFTVPALLALVAGCATTASAPGEDATQPATRAADKQPAVTAEITRIEPVRPKIELTGEMLYDILVAELAGQRGDLDTSLGIYLDLARKTRDPKVVERATRIAVFARNVTVAKEVASIWVELDPLNPDPHQVLAIMALREGDREHALEHLEDILKYAHGEVDQKLLMIANLLGREQDRNLVLELMDRLVADRHDEPEALYAFAHVAARLGDLDRAASLLEETLKLAPDNDNAVLSYITTLQRQERTSDAIAFLEKELKRRKDNDYNLRLAYARLLTDAQRFDDARRQFELLSVQAPNNTDVLYALGLLYLQADRSGEAEPYFTRLLGREGRGDDASYYLGRIAEERKDLDKATAWYLGVQGGDNYFDAQVRLGLILAKQDRLDEARTHLHSVRTRNAQERAIVTQAEGEMLSESGRYDDAMDVYDHALAKGFNSDLLYARAMLAEKMDRLDILEQDLRTLLEREPDNAQALNALGYTLADRTERYDEALGLIQRALDISPDDFYILDSMGWVLYRLGRLEEATDYLKRALGLRQDPEIAAHLGEVLWVKGDQDAASSVWNTALQATPDDSHLLDVIKRFKP